MRVATAVLAAGVVLVGGFVVIQGRPGGASQAEAAEPGGDGDPAVPVLSEVASSTTTSTSTTTSSTSTTSTSLPAPSQELRTLEARYLVPLTEAEPEAKQLATDIAYSLTTYEVSDDHWERLTALGSRSGVDALAQASGPLIYSRSWSRGQVIYPQMGGLDNGRASVMVVTRQTVGSGSETSLSVVRTLDIRLVLGATGWEFDALASAGGLFDNLEDLTLADAVASDPRIEMPDTARRDILAGTVSPILLGLMEEIADRTPYGVTVLVTGHPHNVFETDRLSDHTVGRAVDIYRVGDRDVVDDRGSDSVTNALVMWLYDRSDVIQVGSPWDLDGELSTRSFTNAVHQDHIHLAVIDGP